MPLAKQYPDPFNCVLEKEANVKSWFGEGTNNDVIWSPIFRRNLRDIEEMQFVSLLNLLANVLISEEGEDNRIWIASKDCSFSVSSFYSAISKRTEELPDKEHMEVQCPTKNCGV